MSGSFLFCLSYCKGLLELMSCKQPQKALSSVLSFPKWMCVRIPLPYPVVFSSKLVNITRAHQGLLQILLQGDCPFAASPWSAWVPGTYWEHKYLPEKWMRISMAFENCPNLPLLSESSSGFPAVPQYRFFQAFPTALQESLCP